jgi:glycosyltransferase involved in cell wall biosynthesis
MCGLNKVTERVFHPKIKIQRTIVYNRASAFWRVWTWGICTLHLALLLALKYREFSVLYYTNPPMSYFNGLIFRNLFGIVVFDTYPDSLQLIGIKKSSVFFRIWKSINVKVFPKAQKIITLSQGMKEQLLDYVHHDKVKVVAIWPGSDKFMPIPKSQNSFLKEHEWEDKFIVLYSGNMGIGHQLEILIEVADQLQGDEKILFLFIGEGAKKSLLQRLVKERGLINVKFLSWQVADILPYSLAAADIAVVALEPEATHASLPSKTLNYLAVGAPLLAIGSSGSELEYLINQNKVGFYSKNGKTEDILNYIKMILENSSKKEELSANAFQTSKQYNYLQSLEYLF